MFSTSLECGINVCLVQLQDMQEHVRQSNLQLVFCRLFNLKKKRVSFTKERVLLSLKLKKVKYLKMGQDITK